MNPIYTVTETQIGGRLIPYSTVTSDTAAFVTALRSIADYGALISGASFNVPE